MLLVTADAIVFTTDGRYRTQAGEQLAAAGVDAAHRDRRHAARSSARRWPRPLDARRAGRPRGPRGHLGAAARASRSRSPVTSSSPPRAWSSSCGG